jgi:integrase
VPKTSLTAIGLQSLKAPEAGQVDYWDVVVPGFGCRVSQGGTKTFILKKDNRRITIGRYPILSLADARSEAKKLLAEITLGRTRPQSISYDTARTQFLEASKQKNKARTAAEYKRLLDRLKFSGQLAEFSHDELVRRLEKFKSPSERTHILVAAKVFFNWARKKRYITENPCLGITSPRSQKRSRILTGDELKAVWMAAEQTEGLFGIIVRLLILTGQRRGEIAALEAEYLYETIDAKTFLPFERTCTLPASLTKNGREHTFPIGASCAAILSDVTKNILATHGHISSSSTNSIGLLFPARGKPGRPFNGWSKSKKALDKLAQEIADDLQTQGLIPQKLKLIGTWTLHDLRRTFRTNLAKLKVRPDIAERLVNHISARTEMEEVYDLHTYLPEMRQAMDLWEAHLKTLLAR